MNQVKKEHRYSSKFHHFPQFWAWDVAEDRFVKTKAGGNSSFKTLMENGFLFWNEMEVHSGL